ncbi:MAG: hypothetical protein HY868_11260 [Chloroflexi bacterium]|nr:hypothetical protein [Chloroflexota bacterium]
MNHVRRPAANSIYPRGESRFARELSPQRSRQSPIIRPHDDKANIRVLSPGQDPFVGGGFNADAKELEISQTALRDYQPQYAKMQQEFKNTLFTWRAQRSAATGLPTHLPGWLQSDQVSWSNPVEKATAWLNNPMISQALFGTIEWKSVWRLVPDDLTREVEADVRYQQFSGELPVYGGTLNVHITAKERRVYATSAFFPAPHDLAFKSEVSIEQAVCIALNAVAHYTERTPNPDAQVEIELVERARNRVVKCVDAVPSFAGWHARVVHYAGSESCVLPFGGEYFLATQVELHSPDDTETWTLFIDRESGEVLGLPQSSALHANAVAFSNAGEALHWELVPNAQLTGNFPDADPTPAFIHVKIQTANGEVPFQWQAGPLSHDPSTPEFKAANAAYHAGKMLTYFQNGCAGQPNSVRARLNPATHIDLVVDTIARTKFDFGSTPPRITFQKDPGDGIETAANLVHQPALDPELIYHEVAHALMWLLNPKPFKASPGAPPFARSLLEGYANYFARSLAEQTDPALLWARAAYRAQDVVAGVDKGWGQRWALTRPDAIAGADLFALPNLYPLAVVSEDALPVYDAAMVWARVLWDLRTLVGVDVADRLALSAYIKFDSELVSNFEFASETLSYTAEVEFPQIEWREILRVLFSQRGIVTNQGIQALTTSGQSVVVGADAGVMRFDGQNWSRKEDELVDNQPNEFLRDVVALAVRGNTWYAATETEVYQQGPNHARWRKVAAWKNAKHGRLFALATPSNDDPFVGSGLGALHPNPTWTFYNPQNGTQFEGRLALDLAIATNAVSALCIAGYNAVWTRAANGSWKMVVLNRQADDLVTCLASNDATVYVGTGNVGIWQLQIDQNGETQHQIQVATKANLNDSAVLCLAVSAAPEFAVYAGTTSGAFKGVSRNHAWEWTRLDGGDLPHDATVTQILAKDDVLWAGTALYGLWRRVNEVWEPVDEVDALAGITVPTLKTEQVIALAPSTRWTSRWAVFYLQQATPTLVVDPRPEELWWLKRSVQKIAGNAEDTRIVYAQLEPGYYALKYGAVNVVTTIQLDL